MNNCLRLTVGLVWVGVLAGDLVCGWAGEPFISQLYESQRPSQPSIGISATELAGRRDAPLPAPHTHTLRAQGLG